MPRAGDKAIVSALTRWFAAGARDLPWRSRPLGAPRDPYRVLVSEVMLQQTQAARVSERFDRFLGRFPTIHDLARAPETDILALWSGLGYYRRARLLHRAARAIVEERAGRFPQEPEALARLPGLGRYTAGAIASLAFLRRTPAVDANVARVILRLEGKRWAAAEPRAVKLAWQRAADLHAAAPRAAPTPSLLNEALIELGATVCTPRNPRCDACPVRARCAAAARGIQREIPAPKRAAARKPLFLASVLIADSRGRLAVTRRSTDPEASGLWAGLHQAPTLERHDRAPTTGEIRRALGLPPGRAALTRLGSFPFQTTHRDCTFDVYAAAPPAAAPADWRFLPPGDIADLALATPQRRILLELAPLARSPAP